MYPWFITKNTHGERQACCVTEFIRSWILRPTSSQTQCFVWDVFSRKPERGLERQKIKWYFENNHLKYLNRIDGKSMEFEWKMFTGFTTFGLLEQIQEFMKEQKCDPEQFKGRIIFMSMFTNMLWGEKGHGKMEKYCSRSCGLCSQISSRSMIILGTWIRKEMVRNLFWWAWWNLGQNCWENDAWIRRNHSSVLPVPLKEGNYEAKEGTTRLFISTAVNKTSNWTCAPSCLRISSVSTEQWQIYARKYPKIPWLHGHQKHMQHKILWKRRKFQPNFPLPTLGPMNSDGKTCCKNTNSNSNNYLTLRSYPNFAPTLVWKLSKKNTISSHLTQKDRAEWYENWPSLEHSRLSSWRSLLYWNSGLCFKTEPPLVEKYVKETTETMEDEEHGALGKPIAKARPRMKSTITLTPVSVPLRERKCVDVDAGSYDYECLFVSKAMIRSTRHDQNILRETDGAVKCEDIVEEFNKRKRKYFEGASQWSLEDWISILVKGRGAKKTLQCCLNPDSSTHISYFWAIQGHSGGIAIDPELQDKVLLPQGLTEYIYHVRNVSEVHSIIRSGLILRGQSRKRGRHSVFFTLVNPMEDENCVEETSCDLTKSRFVPYKNTWNSHQNTAYWCTLKIAQEKRLAVLPDKVTYSRSLQHTACSLHRKRGMHEGEGWAIPKGTLYSETTAGCIKIELANWSTRSTRTTRTGRKNVLWPTKRIKIALGNREQHRGLESSWCTSSAVEHQDTHRKDKVEQLIEKFEN